ncbi:outer membrane beta-barrel protein [Archangium lansingense]|uniref:Outer membrane beta-barrel protein n=1 Tax=Archangium lansingense TaxID=2995310 RepID=A0ABT4AMF0_9BACT|nr:outer membrane beta-barrel protein [Archangium lansinium]MCY1082877.1 outer membrane beta-barrel protein [Archangium lansinium]
MKSVIRLGLCVAALWGGAALAGEDWKDPAYGGSGVDSESVYQTKEQGSDKGLYVLLGAGTEGYTGELAPDLNVGFSYGATVGFKPTRGLGLELAYSGGMTDIDTFGPGGAADGGDIIRNGGQAAVTIGLSPTKLQPYLMGGIGIENHNVRGLAPLADYQDDTSGYVPAGVGLRYNIGSLLTADARVSYNIPFEQEFAPVDNDIWTGRYQALLQLGGTY